MNTKAGYLKRAIKLINFQLGHKKKKTQIFNIKNEMGVTTTDPMDSTKVIKKHDE